MEFERFFSSRTSFFVDRFLLNVTAKDRLYLFFSFFFCKCALMVFVVDVDATALRRAERKEKKSLLLSFDAFSSRSARRVLSVHMCPSTILSLLVSSLQINVS